MCWRIGLSSAPWLCPELSDARSGEGCLETGEYARGKVRTWNMERTAGGRGGNPVTRSPIPLSRVDREERADQAMGMQMKRKHSRAYPGSMFLRGKAASIGPGHSFGARDQWQGTCLAQDIPDSIHKHPMQFSEPHQEGSLNRVRCNS